ncbi:MAG: OB-fold domain-containing protein [Acidimicrobiia bacterium]
MQERLTTHTIEFPYTRTLGPVYSAFLTGMRDGQVLGIKSRDGRVLCPPTEWDPTTGDALDGDLVPVGPGGVVTTWAWVTEPSRKHPLDHPFAFALIKLDGADTGLLHVVDAGGIDSMQTGMRVVPRWKQERIGHITDLEAFVPEGSK